MHAICTRGLSTSEAEHLVAEVWLAVEEYRLPSPKLDALTRSEDWQIQFLFQSRAEVDLVRSKLLSCSAFAEAVLLGEEELEAAPH